MHSPNTGLRHPSFKEGAGKRCSECVRDADHCATGEDRVDAGSTSPVSDSLALCRLGVCWCQDNIVIDCSWRWLGWRGGFGGGGRNCCMVKPWGISTGCRRKGRGSCGIGEVNHHLFTHKPVCLTDPQTSNGGTRRRGRLPNEEESRDVRCTWQRLRKAIFMQTLVSSLSQIQTLFITSKDTDGSKETYLLGRNA